MNWLKRMFGIVEAKPSGLNYAEEEEKAIQKEMEQISEPVISMVYAISTRPKTIKWRIPHESWNFCNPVPVEVRDTVTGEKWKFFAIMRHVTMLTKLQDLTFRTDGIIGAPTWLTTPELKVLTETVKTVYGERIVRFHKLADVRRQREKDREEGRRRVFDAAERRRLTEIYKKA